VLFPGTCEIRVQENKIILCTNVSPSHDSSIGYPSPDSKGAGAMVSTTNVCTDVNTTVPARDKIKFSGTSSLSYDALTILNTLYEENATQDRLNSRVEITVPTLFYKGKEKILYGGTTANFSINYELLRTDWLEWLYQWGYQTTLMYLPSDVYSLLKSQMKMKGYTKEWEIISMAMRTLEKPVTNVNVLRGNPSSQLFRERLKDIISRVKKCLFIVVTTIDNSLANEIIQAVNRGADVKIVVGSFDNSILKQSRTAKGVGFKNLMDRVQIRSKEGFHGRMVIADDSVMIGSVDLDNQGLTVHDNLAILTDETTAVASAKEIFYELFKESKKLSTSGVKA
jgi:sugar-specific transcriptional regulator TrmB